MMCIKFARILIFLVCLPAYSQINDTFVRHLINNQLPSELKSYLAQVQLPEDSSSYYQMQWHHHFGSSAEMLSHAFCASELLKSDSSNLLLYSVEYLDPRSSMTEAWFDHYLDSSMLQNEVLRSMHLTYQLSKYPDSQGTIPKPLEKDYLNLVRANNKKPFIAGGLSAIVPGLGLLYLNKPRGAISNFIFISALGLQTAESVNHFGWKHPFTIVNGSFLLGYYLVNVFGSALEVKKNLFEQRKQFLIHASRYYTDVIAHPVH